MENKILRCEYYQFEPSGHVHIDIIVNRHNKRCLRTLKDLKGSHVRKNAGKGNDSEGNIYDLFLYIHILQIILITCPARTCNESQMKQQSIHGSVAVQ